VADDDAREAIREAYQAYYRRLVATLYGLTADYAEAQDLVQEAYARALARPKTFLDVTDPEAWLRTVAVNLARTRWRRRRLLDTMIRTGRVTPTPESVPGANPNRVLLIAALAKLSRPTRETIVLHHIADMSVQEVADQLGIPVGTVKARLSRGRALLADLLHEAAPTAAVPSSRPAPSMRTAVSGGRVPVSRRAGILPDAITSATAPVPAGASVDGRAAEDIGWPGPDPADVVAAGDVPHPRAAGTFADGDAIDGNAIRDAHTLGNPDTTQDMTGRDGLARLLDGDSSVVDDLVSIRGRRR
jgi:RNA polymerase sigma-70 factor (ECF subfamily)